MKTTHKLLLNHLLCHIALIPGFIYGDLWMFVAGFIWYYIITICSSSAGYHRYYSHQSFKTGKWFEWYTNFLSLFVLCFISSEFKISFKINFEFTSEIINFPCLTISI